MIQSNSSQFIKEISIKYKSYEKELLPTFLGKDVCGSMKNEETQQLFKYQEFLYQYMKALNQIPEKELKQRGLLIYHGLGSGKCHAKNTPILMHDGSLKMAQDIIIGDLLMGDDSTPRKVLDLGRGKDIMYEIKPIKGESFTVNSEHILCLKISPDGVSKIVNKRSKNQKKFFCATYIDNKTLKRISKYFETKEEGEKYLKSIIKTEEDTIVEIEVNKYLELPKNIKSKLKLYRTGIEFEVKKVNFDPYIIGFWLGDGSSNNTEITTQDATIIKYLKEKLSYYNCYLQHSNKYTYRINSLNNNRNNEGKFISNNSFLNELTKQNLINNKHIPNDYKINSREVRLQVLAGLIDSDGHYSRGTYEFVQKNEKLIDDVIYLARSLGFAAYKKIKKTSWTYNGVKKYSTAFRIVISGDINDIPVKIKRKIADKRKQKKNVLVTGFKVIEKDIDNYYGFTLDKNNRYVIGDFTVTHNTMTGILLAEASRTYILNEADEDYKTQKQYQRKVILMMPANLLFDPWIKEIGSKCFENCKVRNAVKKVLKDLKGKTQDTIKKHVIELLKQHDYHIIFYNAQNIEGGWRDKLKAIPTRKSTADKYTNKYSERNNEFDDSVVIIDEFHNLVNMFSNKVESGQTQSDSINLYTKLVTAKNMRIVGLTGTPIVNKPFEVAIIANLIRGQIEGKPEIEFKLDIENFNNLFFSENMTTLKNGNMLKRRLNGLISYYRGIDETAFAKEILDEVHIPMGIIQERGYNIATRLEMVKRGKKIKKNIENLSFENEALPKIKASNVVFPDYIFNSKMLTKKLLTKNGIKINAKSINNKNHLLDGKITKEDEKTILKILDNDSQPLNVENELSDISRKVYHIIKKAKASNGPVLIYSRFEGLFGIRFITEALKQNGFEDYDKNGNKTGVELKASGKDKDTFMIWTGKHRINETKEIFNSLKNKNGELIKIFCMTASGKEGINLLGIRQIHLVEPWWNNVIDRQVIARGIRICSHSHIPEEDFIDFRLDQANKIYNERIVNVFKYYIYPDLRYRFQNLKKISQREMNEIKKATRQEMIDMSIDNRIREVSKIKQQQEEIITNIFKDVSIDCNINKIRNQEKRDCFIDYTHNDYFKAWNIRDNYMVQTINNKAKKISFNGKKYLVDSENNVYEDLEKNGLIDNNLYNNKIIKIGVYRNNNIEFDEYYKQRQQEVKIDNVEVVNNNFKKVLENILDHNLEKKSLIDITNINKNTFIFQSMFDKLEIIVMDEDRLSFGNKISNVKISKVSDLKSLITKKSDYINIDTTIQSEIPIEHLCNLLTHTAKYILVDVSSGGINTNLLINDFYFAERYNILVIMNDKSNTSLTDFLKKNFKISEISNIIDNFMKLNINSLDTLKDLVKTNSFISLEHTMSPLLVKKVEKNILTKFNIKQKILTAKKEKKEKKDKKEKKEKKKKDKKEKKKKDKKTVKEDCMANTLADIKKSAEYKALPKSVGKSKLKKKQLCDEIARLP
jgi:hypothetical protein